MRRFSRWLAFCLAALSGQAICSGVRADEPPRTSANECKVRNIEYNLAARLRLTDTPFGAGNGVYDIGPGRLMLRVTALQSPDSYSVELIDYKMQSHFTVRSKVLFWKARVLTHTDSHVASGVAGKGKLAARKLTWSTPILGYEVNGTLNCSGSGCGMSGVPPDGESSLHVGPEPVRFAPFVFGDDSLTTFKMGFTKLTHTDQPRQTNYITFAGRKTSERCVEGS